MATVARRRSAPAVMARRCRDQPGPIPQPRDLHPAVPRAGAGAGRGPRCAAPRAGKFAAIFASNLDEFYQVRVAGLKRQVAAGTITTSPDGLTAAQQLYRIDRRTQAGQPSRRLFADEIRPALAAAGIPIVRWNELDDAAQATMRETFNDQIFPVLTPGGRPGHPFPYISNLSLNLAVLVRDQASRRRLFARIKVPPLLPRFMFVEGNGHGPVGAAGGRHRRQPGQPVPRHGHRRVMVVPGHPSFDLEIDDDEAEDLLATIEEELRRQRFSRAVRLEVEEGMPDHVIALLTRELQVSSADAHELPAPLGLTDLWSLVNLDRPDLKPPPFHPVTPRALAPTTDGPADIFSALRASDILVHHPYDSFAGTVQAFIEQAARSIGPRHQADAVPDLGRESHRRRPDPGGGCREAGRRAGRAQGPPRRGGEHRGPASSSRPAATWCTGSSA